MCVRRRPRVPEHTGVDVRLHGARSGAADQLARGHRPAGSRAADPERAAADVVDGRREAELVAAADARDRDLLRRALVEIGQQLLACGDAPDVHGGAGAEHAHRSVRRVRDDVAALDNEYFRPVGREGRGRLPPASSETSRMSVPSAAADATPAGWANAILRPSGDQAGSAPENSVETWPPDDATTTIAPSRANARRRPSGDHAGRASVGPDVTARAELPFRRATTIRPARTNASRRPSGDHEGSLPLRSARTPVPSALMA